MEYLNAFFDWNSFVKVWPLLVQGLWMTIKLSLIIVPLAIFAGLGVAVAQRQPRRWLNRCIMLAVDVLRSFPPLMLLILIFYGLPFVGVNLSEVQAVVLALVMNGASYFSEIFRAGINAVPVGQTEAARSTGLSAWQCLVHVVIPQGVRNVMPDLTSNTLELVKQTSIASAVALQELLRAAQIGQGLVYNPTPVIAAAIIYFLLLWPLVRWISRMQKANPIPCMH